MNFLLLLHHDNELETTNLGQTTWPGEPPPRTARCANGVQTRLRPADILGTLPTHAEQDAGVPTAWQYLRPQPTDPLARSGQRGHVAGQRRVENALPARPRAQRNARARNRTDCGHSLPGPRHGKSALRTLGRKGHPDVLHRRQGPGTPRKGVANVLGRHYPL